tara:strand:+ start:192 stop:368 length:177 start_codon:yes stop_codon:yes gene_type:complete
MVVKKIYREKTKQKEYALLSIKTKRPLKWFGTQKPTEQDIAKEEKRVQFFRHMRNKKE